MKYKVGDKVRIVKAWPKDRSAHQNPDGLMDKWLDKVMTIKEVRGVAYFMVEDQGDRHGGRSCWVWNDACIAGPVNEKIIVMTDGKTTTAKLFRGKELVKSAEAKCSPSDAFDFEKGAALAVDRLLGREEKKPANPFKAGDYARVIGNTHYCHGFPIGSVGRVKRADDERHCEIDGFDRCGGRLHQTLHSCDLEKI